jgi:hypothetical protein
MSKKAKWKNHQRDNERLAVVQTVFMAISLRNSISRPGLSLCGAGRTLASALRPAAACPLAAVSLQKPDHYTTFAAERNPANAPNLFHLMNVDERLMQKVPRSPVPPIALSGFGAGLHRVLRNRISPFLFYGFSQNGCNDADYILPFVLLARAVS